MVYRAEGHDNPSDMFRGGGWRVEGTRLLRASWHGTCPASSLRSSPTLVLAISMGEKSSLASHLDYVTTLVTGPVSGPLFPPSHTLPLSRLMESTNYYISGGRRMFSFYPASLSPSLSESGPQSDQVSRMFLFLSVFLLSYSLTALADEELPVKK